ncbi:hypothetical protein GCM10017044_17970 [Kordiimonas sediminis]|uniref:Glutamate--cysteine ligase n=1 Tax=Kordiimonas sediminis TaxID=1735581 RepID=A0A919ARM9_9PROT|nr:hypothetical protein [Kordiimonas sediminis]GHF23806.1 hypothetical protein GCM10017044_17970 [Kordiimonas sediminis]
MGEKVTRKSFSDQDYEDFDRVLHTQLGVLKEVIRSPDFGTDPLCVGAELEMYLVDRHATVCPKAAELMAALDDPQYQAEINKYNLELNLSHQPAKGTPFSGMLSELQQKAHHLDQVAEDMDITIVPIGILPTLEQSHLERHYMTEELRYEVLSKQLADRRGRSFEININGEESVALSSNDVTVEGANTSFQVHMMVEHARFADIFNAAQLTVPLVTAVSGNSGILLGNRLWDETRVALFKQSLDTRVAGEVPWQAAARVSFGQGWIRDDSWEIFAETVALFEPVLPILGKEDAEHAWRQGDLPRFDELKLQMGTSWPWHRAVYSRQGQGHVRIEFRAIPAGPTPLDMMANAAFAMGLAVGMADEIKDFIAVVPFRYAEYNFYRAAQSGMDAKILWPSGPYCRPVEQPVRNVLDQMFEYASKGLRQLEIEDAEIDTYLGIIEKRIHVGQTGARWTKNGHRYLENLYGKKKASEMVTHLYLQNSRNGNPVAEWEPIWS